MACRSGCTLQLKSARTLKLVAVNLMAVQVVKLAAVDLMSVQALKLVTVDLMSVWVVKPRVALSEKHYSPGWSFHPALTPHPNLFSHRKFPSFPTTACHFPPSPPHILSPPTPNKPPAPEPVPPLLGPEGRGSPRALPISNDVRKKIWFSSY